MLPLHCFHVVVQFEFEFFEFGFKLNLFEVFCKKKKNFLFSLPLFLLSAQQAQLHPSLSLSLFIPAAQKLHTGPFHFLSWPSSRTPAQLTSPSLSDPWGPLVGGVSYPGSGTDSAESGRTPRSRGLLGPHAKGRCPPLYKAPHPPLEPYPAAAAFFCAPNPSTAAIDELELGVATALPFPPLPVDFKPPRSFAPR